jgi:vancomycin resistance protein YoaR
VARSVLPRLCVLGALAAAGGGAAWAAVARWWPLALARDPEAALPGVRIDGETLTTVTSVRALAGFRALALAQRRIRLVVRDGDGPRLVLETTLGDLGVSVDVDTVAERVLHLGRADDMLTEARIADRARRGEVDVPLEPRVNPNAAIERLVRFKDDLDAPAADARLDLDHHQIVPERDGRSLDLDQAAAAVARAAIDPGQSEIDLPFARVVPSVTRASLGRVDVSHVLASFGTYFSRHGDQGPRARNIEVAASHVDGLVVEPGQLVSFNDIVGARIEENGFKKSFEIFKGEMVEGTGGGTCQVASTLHALAVFGGLDIVQRLPHSRPSGYIQAGLDATVVYPTVDLKLRNPFSFPVVVHATVVGNRISMDLLGADKPVIVTFGRDVLSTTAFARKVVEEPGLETPKRKQKGIDGMEILRTRVLSYRSGTRRVESSHDMYPPTQEIWQVPTGYDENDLPPLGEDFPKI